MLEKIRHLLIELFRASLLLLVCGAFIAVVALNNSSLMVGGSDLSVTIAGTPLWSQMLALLIVMLTVFVVIYEVFKVKLVYLLLMLVFALVFFVFSTHRFVWNYTESKIEDVWLLYSVQQMQTQNKSASVVCKISDYGYELTDANGQSMSVFKGFFPWLIVKDQLISGCPNRKELIKKPVAVDKGKAG